MVGNDCRLRVDGVRRRIAEVVFGEYPCMDNPIGPLAAKIRPKPLGIWMSFVEPATQREEIPSRDAAGKEKRKMSSLMQSTKDRNAKDRMPIEQPFVGPSSLPVHPMTREETDTAFENATEAGDVYSAMRMRANEFKADDKPGRGPRVVGDMRPDVEVVQQGDVGVVLLSDTAFKAMKLSPVGGNESRVQVAVGSGIGARHTVSTREVRVLVSSNAGPLDGPVVEADCPWTLAHPEHQNVMFPPGKYAIRYQRQLAEELRRAAD